MKEKFEYYLLLIFVAIIAVNSIYQIHIKLTKKEKVDTNRQSYEYGYMRGYKQGLKDYPIYGDKSVEEEKCLKK